MIRKRWKMLLVVQVVLLMLLLFAGAAQAARPDGLMDPPHNGSQCHLTYNNPGYIQPGYIYCDLRGNQNNNYYYWYRRSTYRRY